MLVIEDKRKLVIKTAKHGEIQTAIPHAKVFSHQGELLTALEHGVEETLILRNLGFKKTPSPILSYYGGQRGSRLCRINAIRLHSWCRIVKPCA